MSVTRTKHKEEPAHYYDQIYSRMGGYPTDRFQGLYTAVAVKLMDGFKYTADQGVCGDKVTPMVLEIGCGTGVLAQSIIQAGFYYRGFDFSKRALETYPASAIAVNVRFGDAYNSASYRHVYNTVVAVEVFEHLDDLKVLNFIRPSARVVFTVPDFSSQSHLRIYPDENSIREYYNQTLHIPKDGIFKIQMSEEKSIFVCDAVKLPNSCI